MKFSYKFSNLLGTVYKRGNLNFTPDGNRIISPVGNRISIFDLKNSKSETLPIESKLNITTVGISPDGNLMIAVNEEGEAMLISLLSKSVLHYFHFHQKVNAISFSPDGKKFAVTKENTVLVYLTPGKSKEFNPMILQRTFYGAYDETVSVDWTTDSKAFCVGGKDMNVRVYGAQKFDNLIIYSLGGHNDSIVNAFFDNNSLDVYSISRNGQLCIWECDTELDQLVPSVQTVQITEEKQDKEGEEEGKLKLEEKEEKESKILYKKLGKHTYKEARGEGAAFSRITSAAYHKQMHILVTGFQDGAFFLHEMPDFNLIHSLSISDQSISSVVFNNTGDWIGLGCSGMGQLLVWEWQSESYILKQQGHFNNMNCLAYSPDGLYIATGGDDGKVKVWNTMSGFCFVTFSEHLSAISNVTFNQNGQVLLSSSLDGTVRAFDLNRYRNFRTFTSPRPVQFASLAIDYSGEIVCAGGQDTFEIYVWSMQTGRLLDILAGHEGPVSSLAFCGAHAILASGSWDKTVKMWDIFENKGAKETIKVSSDVLSVAYKPDGTEVAVASLDGQITFWSTKNATQSYSIEGRRDLGYSRKDSDKITAKKSALGKAFNTICYSADGKNMLAAGKSKNVCIYSIAEQILIKKFEVTCNLSFDGTEQFLDRRKMTEFGSLALVEEGQGDEDGTAISLPGVKKGDMSSRHWKPEVRVGSIQFSPTGRAWAATSTEGLLIYSLDHAVVFDPFQLEIDITPDSVRTSLEEKNYSTALLLAFRLNEQSLIQEVVEHIPVSFIEVISSSLADVYVDKMLNFIGTQLENSRHIHFYLLWCQKLLILHGSKLKQRSGEIMPILRVLQKNLTTKYDGLSKVCDHNKYLMRYIQSLSTINKKRPLDTGNEDEDMVMDGELKAISDGESSEEEIAMLIHS